MNKYGYTLKRKEDKEERKKRYQKSQLLLMTTYQLKELCRREKIIKGVINPMDKEELIQVILRYRGAEEHYLIKASKEFKSLEEKMRKCALPVDEISYEGGLY